MRFAANKTEAQIAAAQATRYAVYLNSTGRRIVLEGRLVDEKLVVVGFYGGQEPLKIFKSKGLANAFADKA